MNDVWVMLASYFQNDCCKYNKWFDKNIITSSVARYKTPRKPKITRNFIFATCDIVKKRNLRNSNMSPTWDKGKI